MKFCRNCGKTVAILDRSKIALCPDCTLHSQEKKAVEVGNSESSTDIAHATLSVKEGKIVVESKEGWLLWSGSNTRSHSLQQILERASRILKIRARKTR